MSLTETVKRMLNALAHADAGEYLTPLQKTKHINLGAGMRAPDPVPNLSEESSVSTHQQVALYMGRELPAEVMNYVVQTCASLKHGLTVLTFQPETSSRSTLTPYMDSLKAFGIRMELVVLTGEPIAGLARYLRRHPEIAFLACNETGYLGRSFLNGTQKKSALPVPVVLVESHASATQRKNTRMPSSATDKHRVA